VFAATTMIDRNRYGALGRPTIDPNALDDAPRICAKPFPPLGRSQAFTECFNKYARALIASLLFVSGPADVSGFVVPVRVDTVNAVARAGWITDIGVERLEAVFPFRAHPDTATFVIPAIIGTVEPTTIIHRGPRTIDLRVSHSMSIPQCRQMLPLVASAANRPRRLSKERAAGNIANRATSTAASPILTPLSVTQNRPASALFSGMIRLRHGKLHLLCSEPGTALQRRLGSLLIISHLKARA
jgi:hypothetical protein